MAGLSKCIQGGWAAILILGLAACDFSPAPDGSLTSLDIAAGHQGVLPAVIDLRRSDTCPTDTATFSVRFSKPMNRENVQSAIGFYEVLGDARGYDIPVNRDTPIRPQSDSYGWQEQDQLLTFDVSLEDDRQYLLLLPETVTDKMGQGLDGRVGADVQGNGEVDIRMDEGQYARIDDDYLRVPTPFISLPIFLCSDRHAPSIWRTPLNNPRPRVMSFSGRLPSSTVPPAYTRGTTPEGREMYPFTVTDGGYYVERPIPPRGALRLQIASENTAPTKPFGQRRGPDPVLPSTVVGAMDLLDENLAGQQPRAYMDDHLQLPAPLVGQIDSVTGPLEFVSDALKGIPNGMLSGMTLVTSGRQNYRFTFRIVDNDSASGRLTVERVWIRDRAVTRPLVGNFPSENRFLYFGQSQFRENELVGLAVLRPARPDEGPLIIGANTGRTVRIDSGTVQCLVGDTRCEYEIETDFEALEVQGRSFEIVPEYLLIKTERTLNLEQIYALLLNIGEDPILDLYDFSFVDGREDGNEQTRRADDRWTGAFPTGDFELRPIPATLQLNDGRWYSPFPEGKKVGNTIEFDPYGVFTYLGHGVYGEVVSRCESGEAQPRLRSLAMTFATPNGRVREIGGDDLLLLSSVSNANFAAYRMEGRMPETIAIDVTHVTMPREAYLHQLSSGEKVEGIYQGTLPTTVVFTRPLSTGDTFHVAGKDGVCGTSEDLRIPSFREWRPGDRLLISNRVQHPRGDQNTLDGNYDGILSFRELDDIRLEYRGLSDVRPFVRAP